MTAILSLARHTLLDALRARVLRTLAVFLVLLLGAARLLSPLALGEGRRVTLDLGLGFVALFGFLLVLLLGTRLVQNEVEQRTILILLARPLHRLEFLVGKFGGLVAVIAVGLSSMLAILALVLSVSGYAYDISLAVAGYYAFLELVIVGALSMLLTVFTSPLLASCFLVGLYIAGHLSTSLLEMARLVPSAFAARLLEGAFYLLPRLDLYSRTLEVVHGVPARPAELLWATTYAVLYATAALLLSWLIFRRREFA